MKFILSITLVTTCGFLPAQAQVKPDVMASELTPSQSKAKKLYERLTGVKLPADSPLVNQMGSLISQGNAIGAAQIATQDPNFYNITVKLMALPLSTREETVKTQLNDFVASFIGVTRDGRDARELLTGNFFYQGSGANAPAAATMVADVLISNKHYADLESRRVDLAANLVRVEGQLLATNATTTVPNPDPAGVLTSRGFMGAHALAGTNRRLLEYTFREFMCVPLDRWADTSASDLRIGRDIDRFPAGDHMKYETSCKGCHTVMDGFRGAFAKWDVNGNGSLVNSAVHPRGGGAFQIDADARGIITKMNRNNNVFPSGYITTDSSFVNNAIRPANADLFGWRSSTNAGVGVKDFGAMVSNSTRFSQCMAKRVYETVCRKTVNESGMKSLLATWGQDFERSGYKLKNLFEAIAVKPECLGS